MIFAVDSYIKYQFVLRIILNTHIKIAMDVDMKKISSLIVVLILTACASAPATWKGMSERDISAWKEIGFNAEKAQAWRGSGFTPEQSSRWSTAGFNLENAGLWSKQSFNAEEAKNWNTGGFDLENAVESRDKGLTPVKADD